MTKCSLINGKKIAQEIQKDIAHETASLFAAKKRPPAIAFLLVGNDPPSQIYVEAKRQACKTVGIRSHVIALPATVPPSTLLQEINALGRDDGVDAILLQLPLPPPLDPWTFLSAIPPEKDVDGLHPLNMGKTLLGQEGGFVPCTPLGIKILLEKSRIPLEGKRVVIVGRGNLVGKPLAAMLLQKKPGCNATVTVAHRHSKDLAKVTREADVLVAALGQPRFIQKEMVRKGAVVIDVGVHRLQGSGQLVGDVDFEGVSQVASQITPVPGGVGPMTIAMLLQNTLLSYNQRDRNLC